MGYFVVIILLCVSIFEFIRHKTWTAPSVMFCAFWTLISFLASLRLYNLNSVEAKTWLIVLIGVLSFVLGTKIIFRSKQPAHISGGTTEGDYGQNGYLPKKVFWTLFAIVGLYTMGQIIQTIRLLQAGLSLYVIRDASFGLIKVEGYEYLEGALANFIRHLLSAIETILIATGIDFFFRNTQKNKLYIFTAIFLVLCSAISAGGRWILLFFVVEILVCRNILSSKKGKFRYLILPNKKHSGIFLTAIIFIAVIVAFLQISSNRGIENMGKHLYSYICGCVPLLDIKIKEIDQAGTFSYFFAGQYGFWCFAMPILRRLTGYKFPLFFETTINHVMTGQDAKNIGSGYFNAFTTAFYYLYADLRFIGIIVGMLIFGVIAGNMFQRAKSTRSPSAVVPYLFILQTIVSSIQIYAFGSADNVFTFEIMIIIYILTRYKFKLK